MCRLHNIVRKRDGYKFDDTLSITSNLLRIHSFDQNHDGIRADSIRNEFAEYFVSPEGELSWQYNKA